MAAEKADWRRRFRAQRAATAPEALAAASAAIVQGVEALSEVHGAGCVHLFWPLAGRGEIDLRPLADGLRRRGVRVALPVVASRAPPTLAHRLYLGRDTLVDGPWGLSEPAPQAPAVLPSVLDVVLVPALGIDRRGVRLGYGGGFYDAFLADTEALRVGVVLGDALVDRLPDEPTDIRMDRIVTPHGTVHTPRSR